MTSIRCQYLYDIKICICLSSRGLHTTLELVVYLLRASAAIVSLASSAAFLAALKVHREFAFAKHVGVHRMVLHCDGGGTLAWPSCGLLTAALAPLFFFWGNPTASKMQVHLSKQASRLAFIT